MKTCLAIFGLALVAPIYGKAYQPHWGGHHSRFHHGLSATSGVSGTATGISSGFVTGTTASPSSVHNFTSSLSYDTTATTSSAASSSSSPAASNSSSISGVGPADHCYRPNGIPMGWLPDGVDIMTLQNQVETSYPPCTYGNYAQITDPTNMDGPDQQMLSQGTTESLQGAIYDIALQPIIPFSEVSASAVNASMTKLLAQGPQVVWLRLAHEVNWYISTNTINTDPSVRYTGTTDEYKAMWQAVANAVDRSRVKMFWSLVPPFSADMTVDTLDAEWFPGSEYVDIVGLDAYGETINGEQSTFETQMGDFCAKYPEIPVALAETGWLNGGTAEEKQFWLEQISANETLSVCPQYIGFSWFEYVKEGDYRIVLGPDGNIAKDVLATAKVAS